VHGDEDQVERRIASALLEKRVFDLAEEQAAFRKELDSVKRNQLRMTVDVAALPGKVKAEVTTALKEERDAARKSAAGRWTKFIQIATLVLVIIGTGTAVYAAFHVAPPTAQTTKAKL
jgi:hypothetical protein